MSFPSEVNAALEIGGEPWAILRVIEQVACFNRAIEYLLKPASKVRTAIPVMGDAVWSSAPTRLLEPTMNEGIGFLISRAFCISCNLAKGTMTDIEFREKHAGYLPQQERTPADPPIDPELLKAPAKKPRFWRFRR